VSDISPNFEMKPAGRQSQKLTSKNTKMRVYKAYVDACYWPRPAKCENYDSKVVKFSTRERFGPQYNVTYSLLHDFFTWTFLATSIFWTTFGAEK